MKITDIRTLKDVLDNGRHDICLKIAAIAEFEENVRKYEETGLSLYKDKATGRYYHIVLWDEIIRRLREEDKEKIIDELALPEPSCKVCPIAERAGQCSDENSAYYKFSTALDRGDIVAAIKYAEVIADAWTK